MWVMHAVTLTSTRSIPYGSDVQRPVHSIAIIPSSFLVSLVWVDSSLAGQVRCLCLMLGHARLRLLWFLLFCQPSCGLSRCLL